MKYRLFIRNHNRYRFGPPWYLFGVGYNCQGVYLIVWQLWMFGFCLCLLVDGEGKKHNEGRRPFPLNYMDWKRRRKYRKSQ